MTLRKSLVRKEKEIVTHVDRNSSPSSDEAISFSTIQKILNLSFIQPLATIHHLSVCLPVRPSVTMSDMRCNKLVQVELSDRFNLVSITNI